MPRDHYKSTCASESLPLWGLIRDRNTSFALISAHHDNTKKWLNSIKNTIEYNRLFRFAFREIRPGEKWDEEQIRVTREHGYAEKVQASIATFSINSGLASQHFPNVILDDAINEQSAKSESEVATAVQLFRDLEDILDDWETSNFWVVGTPWPGGADVHQEFLRFERMGSWLKWGIGVLGDFEISEAIADRPELRPNVTIGQPILPEACPWDKINYIRETDIERYYYQYLCKPHEAGRNGFDIGAIKDFALFPDGRLECQCHSTHRHYLAEMCLIGLSDPAFTEDKRGCESSITFVAKARCQCRFVLEEWGGFVPPDEYIKRSCDLAWGQMPWLKAFAVEKVNFQTVLKSWLTELQGRPRADGRGTEFPLGVELLGVVPAGRSKDGRIGGQQGPVNNGLWHKRPTMRVDKTGSLLDQISRWPAGKKRDRVDGWAYCDDAWEALGFSVAEFKEYRPEKDPNIERALSDFHLMEQDDEGQESISRVSRALLRDGAWIGTDN